MMNAMALSRAFVSRLAGQYEAKRFAHGNRNANAETTKALSWRFIRKPRTRYIAIAKRANSVTPSRAPIICHRRNFSSVLAHRRGIGGGGKESGEPLQGTLPR